MNTIKTKIKAIIFDMDDTIIDSGKIWKQTAKDLLLQHGITQLTPENIQAFKKYSSGGLYQYCQLIKEQFNLSLSVEQLLQQKMNLARNRLSNDPINFINGFQDFHKKLKQHSIQSGIATNANIESLNILKKRFNLETFFGKNIYCIEHVENKAKPDPAVFLHTAKQLNVKPEECIIFEDSVVGFQAAKAAGIKCIAIKNEVNKDFLHQADAKIDNYHQAEKALKNLLFDQKPNFPSKIANLSQYR